MPKSFSSPSSGGDFYAIQRENQKLRAENQRLRSELSKYEVKSDVDFGDEKPVKNKPVSASDKKKASEAAKKNKAAEGDKASEKRQKSDKKDSDKKE